MVDSLKSTFAGQSGATISQEIPLTSLHAASPPHQVGSKGKSTHSLAVSSGITVNWAHRRFNAVSWKGFLEHATTPRPTSVSSDVSLGEKLRRSSVRLVLARWLVEWRTIHEGNYTNSTRATKRDLERVRLPSSWTNESPRKTAHLSVASLDGAALEWVYAMTWEIPLTVPPVDRLQSTTRESSDRTDTFWWECRADEDGSLDRRFGPRLVRFPRQQGESLQSESRQGNRFVKSRLSYLLGLN